MTRAASPSKTIRIVFEGEAPVPDFVYAALGEHYGRTPGSVLLKLRYVHSPAYTAAVYRESVRRAKEVLGEKGVRVAAVLELCGAFDGLKVLVDPTNGLPDELRGVARSGVPAACEVPLSLSNQERMDEILALIARSGIRAWRLAPTLEARRALERAVDFVVTEQPAVRIEPVDGYLERVRHFADPRRSYSFCDRRGWERTLRIDATGAVRAAGGEILGDLASSSLDAIFAGESREKILVAAERRMASVCGACRFFGSCDGEAVAEADEGGCPLLAPMLEYAEKRLALPDENRPAELRRGARIFGADEAFRVALSAGTEVARSGPGVRFHVGALTPREPFRPLDAAERALFAPEAPFRRDSDVALLKLDDALLAPLRGVCAADREPAHPAWRDAVAMLAEGLGGHLQRPWTIETSVVYRSAPGLATVTKVERGLAERETYVGLHLDSWEGVSLRSRSSVRNRLSVNLGHGSRYLLFVNLTLAEMMRALGLDDAEDVHDVTLFSGHRFMRTFPRYPVTRVEVLPGEAYICPTGNLVHDGASGADVDVALHLLGFFTPI